MPEGYVAVAHETEQTASGPIVRNNGGNAAAQQLRVLVIVGVFSVKLAVFGDVEQVTVDHLGIDCLDPCVLGNVGVLVPEIVVAGGDEPKGVILGNEVGLTVIVTAVNAPDDAARGAVLHHLYGNEIGFARLRGGNADGGFADGQSGDTAGTVNSGNGGIHAGIGQNTHVRVGGGDDQGYVAPGLVLLHVDKLGLNGHLAGRRGNGDLKLLLEVAVCRSGANGGNAVAATGHKAGGAHGGHVRVGGGPVHRLHGGVIGQHGNVELLGFVVGKKHVFVVALQTDNGNLVYGGTLGGEGKLKGVVAVAVYVVQAGIDGQGVIVALSERLIGGDDQGLAHSIQLGGGGDLFTHAVLEVELQVGQPVVFNELGQGEGQLGVDGHLDIQMLGGDGHGHVAVRGADGQVRTGDRLFVIIRADPGGDGVGQIAVELGSLSVAESAAPLHHEGEHGAVRQHEGVTAHGDDLLRQIHKGVAPRAVGGTADDFGNVLVELAVVSVVAREDHATIVEEQPEALGAIVAADIYHIIPGDAQGGIQHFGGQVAVLPQRGGIAVPGDAIGVTLLGVAVIGGEILHRFLYGDDLHVKGYDILGRRGGDVGVPQGTRAVQEQVTVIGGGHGHDIGQIAVVGGGMGVHVVEPDRTVLHQVVEMIAVVVKLYVGHLFRDLNGGAEARIARVIQGIVCIDVCPGGVVPTGGCLLHLDGQRGGELGVRVGGVVAQQVSRAVLGVQDRARMVGGDALGVNDVDLTARCGDVDAGLDRHIHVGKVGGHHGVTRGNGGQNALFVHGDDGGIRADIEGIVDRGKGGGVGVGEGGLCRIIQGQDEIIRLHGDAGGRNGDDHGIGHAERGAADRHGDGGGTIAHGGDKTGGGDHDHRGVGGGIVQNRSSLGGQNGGGQLMSLLVLVEGYGGFLVRQLGGLVILNDGNYSLVGNVGTGNGDRNLGHADTLSGDFSVLVYRDYGFIVGAPQQLGVVHLGEQGGAQQIVHRVGGERQSIHVQGDGDRADVTGDLNDDTGAAPTGLGGILAGQVAILTAPHDGGGDVGFPYDLALGGRPVAGVDDGNGRVLVKAQPALAIGGSDVLQTSVVAVEAHVEIVQALAGGVGHFFVIDVIPLDVFQHKIALVFVIQTNHVAAQRPGKVLGQYKGRGAQHEIRGARFGILDG